MTTIAAPMQRTSTGAPVWVGRLLKGLAVLFLIMDAGGKLLIPDQMIAHSPPLGLPADASLYRSLGALLLVCTGLYAWPRTAAVGAVLLTGYLGGAVALHVRAASPLFGFTLFPIYVGVTVWTGLLLQDAALRSYLLGRSANSRS